jgi:hypothetical protein
MPIYMLTEEKGFRFYWNKSFWNVHIGVFFAGWWGFDSSFGLDLGPDIFDNVLVNFLLAEIITAPRIRVSMVWTQ